MKKTTHISKISQNPCPLWATPFKFTHLTKWTRLWLRLTTYLEEKRTSEINSSYLGTSRNRLYKQKILQLSQSTNQIPTIWCSNRFKTTRKSKRWRRSFKTTKCWTTNRSNKNKGLRTSVTSRQSPKLNRLCQKTIKYKVRGSISKVIWSILKISWTSKGTRWRIKKLRKLWSKSSSWSSTS